MAAERALSAGTPRDDALKFAKRILAAYPNVKPHDARGYVANIVAHISQYPPDLVARIADPRDGVVTVSKFPPTVAEIAAFAEGEIEARRQHLQRLRADLTAAKERVADDAWQPWGIAEERAKHAAEKRAEYRRALAKKAAQ